MQPSGEMDLWLSPHDFRVRSLRSSGKLTCGYGSSPFGDCVALATESHLLALHFVNNSVQLEDTMSSFRTEWPRLSLNRSLETETLIIRAFRTPMKVPVMAIGTPFQLSVWEFLRSSLDPETLTYGEVAKAIGRPKAARAVGRAVGANGIAFLIPCHRVVSRGKQTGYRWGVERKKQILAWELEQRDPLQMPF